MKLAFSFLGVAICVLFAGSLHAADMNGHWSGNYEYVRPDGEESDVPVYMILKQEGDKLTGTLGDNVDERPNAVTGTLQGNKVEMDVKGFKRSSHISATLDDDVIRGTSRIVRPDQTEVEVKVVIKRVK